MTSSKRILLIIFCITRVMQVPAEPLKVVSYNVENLFHPKHDTIWESKPDSSINFVEKDDYEWTPEGERRWSYNRYYQKVENIARVLTNIGEWDGVDIVGLQEIENALVVKRLCYTLRQGEYDFVHYESPDQRGIDVALIYKKNRVDTLRSEKLRVEEERDGEKLVTRDILYVCARIDHKDTIHFFVCHLPSQRGGRAESEWKREAAKKVLQQAIDSIYFVSNKAKIIVMGDMNGSPKNDLRGLSNPLMNHSKGTHKYHGHWLCLDQFYISPSINSQSEVRIYDAEWIQESDEKYMGLKPKRTYNGFIYQNGYSDHLPIILTLKEL